MFEKYKKLAKIQLKKNYKPFDEFTFDETSYNQGYWRGLKEGLKLAERHIKKQRRKQR